MSIQIQYNPGSTVFLLADSTKTGTVEAVIIDRTDANTYIVSGSIARACSEAELTEAP